MQRAERIEERVKLCLTPISMLKREKTKLFYKY